MKKLVKRLFVATNFLMALVAFVSASLVDSESLIPTMVFGIAIAYIGCATYIWEAIYGQEE